MAAVVTRGRVWIVVAVAAGCLSLAAAPAAQFTPMPNSPRALLEGHWQSCRESDGHYSERIYENSIPGLGPFELHLGPYHEFAMFRGVQDDHRDHSSSDNLLRPYIVEVAGNRAAARWDVATLRLEVLMGGEAGEGCESWYLSLKRRDPSSSD
jgi:hypothetical protein